MFTKPESIISYAGVSHGMKIADLGCGSGAYTLASSPHALGGSVYAIDIQKDLLARLKNEAMWNSLSNIEYVWGDIERLGGTKLKEDIIDIAFACNVLFQLEHIEGFIAEVARILKNGGKVVVIDWEDSFNGMGPKSSTVIPKERARELFENKGFTFEEYINAGDTHYGIIFTYEK